ncbi:uncharacterized protein L3040_003460 [Drepanopeziza brunnea f. sp. 'multigermtubi']|uniref:uncharacterized protein n=1 Tax=Drepanopeziza brunnea f. sp. 'multigermtubi' TaxID=698441 RepID=UPI002396EEE3|nr:hypothetical protein L3040_003460 [Drepanopeziza brunnea f. sp. 'multigermtubi']
MILLALSFLSVEAQGRYIVGYASLINRHAPPGGEFDVLVVSGFRASADRHRLGSGMYISNDPSTIIDTTDGWYCVISAGNGLPSFPRIYIPEYYERMDPYDRIERKFLWNESEEVILDYIRFSTAEYKRALRFSWFQPNPSANWKLEMMVPADLLRSPILDLKAACFKQREGMLRASSDVINWEGWGIIGYRRYPVDDPWP